MAPSPRPGRIPTWRKLLYVLLTLGVLAGGAEGVCRVLARDLPEPPPTYPTLESYVSDMEHKAMEPNFPEADGELPGARGPQVLMRVPRGSPGALPYEGPGGFYRLLDPAALPGKRRVLVLGASAAYGDGVTFEQTLGSQLQGLLRAGLNDPALEVLNLARPAWELNSVAALAERLLQQLSPAPAAVVLYSGNNELLLPAFHGVGRPTLHFLGAYRLLFSWAESQGYLPPPPEMDYGFFKNPRWTPTSGPQAAERLWRPLLGLQDASYWPQVRRAVVDNYRVKAAALAALLSRRKIPLVLVPPPVNLQLFVAGIEPQPVTFRAVGESRFLELTGQLGDALKRGDRAAIRALADAAPDGPVQRWLAGQWLDAEGRHAEALRQLTEARDLQMGYLGAIPTLGASLRPLGKLPGVSVLGLSGFYPPGKPIRQRARELFNDACHPSPAGHRLLAQETAAALLKLLNPRAAAPPE